MTTLIVDANVWVAAVDTTDVQSAWSREFLDHVTARKIPIALPELAELEVACALARRLRNAELGCRQAQRLLESPLVSTYPLNRAMLRSAIQTGTRRFLRSADALYAALADGKSNHLITWDRELIERAGGFTPRGWLGRHKP